MIVTTQAELDAALAADMADIIIDSPAGVCDELRPITEPGTTAKAKARRVTRACVEVDIDGREVTA